MSALLIEQAGFECAYVSGANVAFSKLGWPDLGLVSMAEVGDTVGYIRDRVELPLVVDADTGFGNALNVQRTVRLFERMGANAIQLEDQVMPKKCGHFRGKKVVPTDEMVGKIKAALDAKHDDDTIIVARTDAIAVEGFDAAMARAEAYVDAGADMLFVEAPRSLDQMKTITSTFKGRTPLLANMVEGGDTPLKSAKDLGDLGYSLVIFPGALNRAYAFMAREFLRSLKENGATAEWHERMYDLAGINDVVELKAMMELSNRYGVEDPDPLDKSE
jgi:2-methylisocitrate lyase-like PEP mutase family enzyme